MKSILMNAEQHIKKDRPFEVDFDENDGFGEARILVVGCGGAGNNTINRLEKIGGIRGVETIAINTDRQHLEATQADKHILIGRGVTKGLGAGGDPVLGYQSTEEDRRDLKEVLRGANMVFLAAGMGGGTGTGAAPVVADIAHELDALVIGVVTLPFQMEGKHRQEKGQFGLKALKQVADTVITLDNNKLMELCPHAPLDYAFSVSDEILAEMIKAISETILEPSLVNLDYAEVRSVMIDGGVAMVGVGESNTNNRAREAVEEALRNRLLEVDYTNAKGALVQVSGGPDMKLAEASAVGEYISQLIGDENSRIVWGARVDESLRDSMKVFLIITGVTSPYISGRVADGGSFSISDLFTSHGNLERSHDIYEYIGIDEIDYGKGIENNIQNGIVGKPRKETNSNQRIEKIKHEKSVSSNVPDIASKKDMQRISNEMLEASKEIVSLAEVANVPSRVKILVGVGSGQPSFRNLKDVTELSDGNLYYHLLYLAKENLILVKKTRQGTFYRLSKQGKDILGKLATIRKEHS